MLLSANLKKLQQIQIIFDGIFLYFAGISSYVAGVFPHFAGVVIYLILLYL